MPFSTEEIESYRNVIYDTIVCGLICLLDAMEGMDLEVSKENAPYIRYFERVDGLRVGQSPFPMEYLEPLRRLWNDPNVQAAWNRRNEVAVSER